jgi:arsenate reductase
MNDRKPVVLFLCSRNSCRSQMAEGFLREFAGERFRIHSAGLEAADEVHPLAVRVMKEVGIDISDQQPESLSDYLGEVAVGYAIIVCAAAAQRCPHVWPGLGRRLEWPFEDPVAYEGTEEERLDKFREVRDKIAHRIRDWLAEMEGTG